MAVGQVADVDIVAHAGAIHGGIVAAIDAQFLPAPARHLGHIRHQVVGNAARVFANQPAFMGANRVEIPEISDSPAFIRNLEIAQNLLAHQLGLAVRIGRGQRKILEDRHGMRIAVDRGRRTEYQLFHVGRLHRRAKRQQSVEIVAVILDRLAHRLANRLQRGKMDRAGNLVFGEQLVQQRAVTHVTFDKIGRRAGNPCQAFDNRPVAVTEIIDTDNVVTRLVQCHPSVGSNIAGGTGQQ
ncbi:hypothetical protein D3C87_1360920 [compost metagenome]